jgi:hypothetical protein
MAVTRAPHRVCRGCGLVSQPDELHRHRGICAECFNRRERWAGQGGIRVVTSGDTVHRTARCPPVRRATHWYLWREEDAFYSLASGGLTACGRCMLYG